MSQETILVYQLPIKKQGERKHFQIKLPNQAMHITGIQTSIKFIGNADGRLKFLTRGRYDVSLAAQRRMRRRVMRNHHIGELKLQSCEAANWFYATELVIGDSDLNFLHHSNLWFRPRDYTHAERKKADQVKVTSSSTILQGWYSDQIGKQQQQDITYEVRLYIHLKEEA